MSQATDTDDETVTIEIDGRTVQAREGETILEAARRADVDIPTLCAHPELEDVGACRMCLVEIDGEHRETACTTAAEDGMSIDVESDDLWDHRRTILELMFAEENHYCMYCEAEGDCELEDMFNRAGLDESRFPLEYPEVEPDSSNEYITMDLDRCISCGRCIRTCDDVVANDTLSFANRGKETTIVADEGVPLGESSCISCGSCVQACPTGALYSPYSAYRGRERDCETVQTTCTECSVGCELEVFTNSGRIVKIEGVSDGTDGGQLCEMGRYGLLADGRDRVHAPSIYGAGQVDLERALDVAREALADADDVAAVASSHLPTETLDQFADAMGAHDATVSVPGTERAATEARIAEAVAEHVERPPSSLRADGPEAVLSADALAVFDTDVVDTHPVAASYVRRAATDGATLVTVDAEADRFARVSDVGVETGSAVGDVAEHAVELIEDGADALTHRHAERLMDAVPALEDGSSVVVVGPGVTDEDTLINAYTLAGATDGRVLSLPPRANAAADRLSGGDPPTDPDVAYLLAADAREDDVDAMLRTARAADTVVVQATRESVLTRVADVVIPALDWFERSGTITDEGGEANDVAKVLDSRVPVDSDRALLDALADPPGEVQA